MATTVLSPAQIASPIRGLLKNQRNTTVVLGEVGEVNKDAKSVYVSNQDQKDIPLRYDILVIATRGHAQLLWQPSNSRPSALPAIDARLLPIIPPIGPPTKVPRAPPAMGRAVLPTSLRTPPNACPIGEFTILPRVDPMPPIRSPRNYSNSSSFATSRNSAASSISSLSVRTPLRCFL